MVKGVNKQIIEINSPQSPYFERAVLFLKKGRSVTDLKGESFGEKELQEALLTASFSQKIKSLRLAILVLSLLLASSVAVIASMLVFCDIF